jgi:hypothetical protein
MNIPSRFFHLITFILIAGISTSKEAKASTLMPQISCEELFISKKTRQPNPSFSIDPKVTHEDQKILQNFSNQQKQLSNQLLKNLGINIPSDDIIFSLGSALDYFLSSQKFKTQRLLATSSPLSEDTSVQMSVVQRNYELAIQYSGPVTSNSNQLLFAQSIRDASNQWNLFSQLPVFVRNEKNIVLKSSDAELWLKIVLDQDVFEPLLGESISFHLTPKALLSIQNDLQRSSVLRHLVWRLIFDIQVEKAVQDIQQKLTDGQLSQQIEKNQMELLASRQAIRRQFLAYLVKVKGFGSSRFSNAAHSYLDAYEISVREKMKSQVSHFLKAQLNSQNRSPDAHLWKTYFQEWQNQIQKSNTHWTPFRWWALLFT